MLSPHPRHLSLLRYRTAQCSLATSSNGLVEPMVSLTTGFFDGVDMTGTEAPMAACPAIRQRAAPARGTGVCIKDVDFDRFLIRIRSGKGERSRVLMEPLRIEGGCPFRVATVSPGDGEAVGGAAPAESRSPMTAVPQTAAIRVVASRWAQRLLATNQCEYTCRQRLAPTAALKPLRIRFLLPQSVIFGLFLR